MHLFILMLLNFLIFYVTVYSLKTLTVLITNHCNAHSFKTLSLRNLRGVNVILMQPWLGISWVLMV